jgi:hypothetical protein
MNPAMTINTNPPNAADAGIRALMALIDELIAVVVEENAELSRGLPASRPKQVDAKHRLADLFATRVAECATKIDILAIKDRILREELLERILRLRTAMDENLIRLRAAIEASNRRIDAVMQGIREQIAKASPYGPGGHRSARPMSCGTNVRA